MRAQGHQQKPLNIVVSNFATILCMNIYWYFYIFPATLLEEPAQDTKPPSYDPELGQARSTRWWLIGLVTGVGENLELADFSAAQNLDLDPPEEIILAAKCWGKYFYRNSFCPQRSEHVVTKEESRSAWSTKRGYCFGPSIPYVQLGCLQNHLLSFASRAHCFQGSW